MKIQFDLTWKNFIRTLGILYLICFTYYWYDIKEEMVQLFMNEVVYLTSVLDIPLFFQVLLLFSILSIIILFPLLLIGCLFVILPLKKTTKELEIEKAEKRIERKYEIKRYKKKLKKLTKK